MGPPGGAAPAPPGTGQGYPAGSALFLLSSEGGTPAAAVAGPFLALEGAGVLVAFASVAGGPARLLLSGGQVLELTYPKGLSGEDAEAAARLGAEVAAQLEAASEPEGPVRDFLSDPATLERLQRCMALRHAFGVSGVSFDGVYVPPGEGALDDLAACERAKVIVSNMVAWKKPVAAVGEGLGLLLGVPKGGEGGSPDGAAGEPMLKGLRVCDLSAAKWRARAAPSAESGLSVGERMLAEGALAEPEGGGGKEGKSCTVVRDGAILTASGVSDTPELSEALKTLLLTYREEGGSSPFI